MPPRDPERFRRQLEKQFRADVEMLYGAYCAKLRAYETMRRLQGDFGEEVDLDLRFLLPEGLPLSLPAAPSPPPAPAPPVPAAPPPAPAPAPAPELRRKSGAHELFKAMVAVLGQLPERFEPRDMIAALGYEPRRSSLHRMLKAMVHDGWLELEERGGGKLANLYRKLPVTAAPESEDADET